MSIDDFKDVEELVKNEVNKPDDLFEGAIESGEKIIRGENSPTEVNNFLRFYRQSLLGKDKQGHLFFGDLQSLLGREKFGIEDLKKLLFAVNDSELWYEFSGYLLKEKEDCPHLLKLSLKNCIEESHDALEKAFLLAMPIANDEIDDQEFRVRNAIRNGLYELQLLFAQHNIHQLAHLEGKRDPQLSDFFGSSIAGLIRLVESAALDEFLRVLLLLWTDIACEFSATPKPKKLKLKQPSSDQQRQYAAYFNVMNKARNWFVHKQIKSIDALDVSFIFMVHARLLREGFADQYRGVLQYEQSLLNEFQSGKASSFKCKYKYVIFSKLWAILGDIHLNEEYKKDVRKIYGAPAWKGNGRDNDAYYDIHLKNYNEHVNNGEFMKVLYRSFYRPDIKLDNCEYMKLFYESFADRADFKGDIVLKSMGVNFNE